MKLANRAFASANETSAAIPSARRAPIVQRSPRVGRAGDAFEQEADRAADWVVGGAAGTAPRISSVGDAGGVQRLADDRDPAPEDAGIVPEEQDQGRAGVQRLERAGAPISPSADVDGALAASRGSGRPLDPPVRDLMESRFGHSFARVRIHADTEGARLSDALGARAFAHRHDLYFAAGEYRPSTHEGRRVLAHELAHVIQQGSAPHASGPASAAPVVSQGAAPAVQRLSAPGRVLAEGVAPWNDGAPTGIDREATTDAGSTVRVWTSYPQWQLDWRFWCHGHSLGTFARWNYSVYSRDSMQAVIRDEYRNIPADQTRAGDLAVWTNGWDHSARFLTPVVTGGALDPDASILSTKNGKRPLNNSATLRSIIGVYGSAGIAVYRHV